MKRTISILLASAICSAFADVRIKMPSDDGVNEITARINDYGMIVPESSTAVYVEPQQRVIDDRKVVIIDPDEYAMLTGRMEVVWHSLNSTADGRRKLHGKIERTEIDEGKREKVEVHADGYRHVETLPLKRRGVAATVKVGGVKDNAPKKPGNISDRQWQMRQQLKVLKQKPAKAVTVEHDATTGKDTVK